MKQGTGKQGNEPVSAWPKAPQASAPESLVRIEVRPHDDATRKNIPAAEYISALRGLTKGNAEVVSVSRSAGTRCQNRWLQATDFVSHWKITLFRWRALKNPGWIYSALPKSPLGRSISGITISTT